MTGKFTTEIADLDRQMEFTVEIEWERWWEAGAYGFAIHSIRILSGVARFRGIASGEVRNVVEVPLDMSDVCETWFMETYHDDLMAEIEAEYANKTDLCCV